MSKELKEPMKESIYTLLGQGYSNRKIAEILNINRKTLNKYAKLYHQNGPKVPTGSEEQNGPKLPAGFQSRSRCVEFHDVIIDLVEKRRRGCRQCACIMICVRNMPLKGAMIP